MQLHTTLQAAALTWALRVGKNKSILHLAGGDQNVGALRLYTRFGFHRVRQDALKAPNRNVFVLPNIAAVLSRLDWRRLLAVTNERGVVDVNDRDLECGTAVDVNGHRIKVDFVADVTE
jgi:hypothetical protein